MTFVRNIFLRKRAKFCQYKLQFFIATYVNYFSAAFAFSITCGRDFLSALFVNSDYNTATQKDRHQYTNEIFGEFFFRWAPALAPGDWIKACWRPVKIIQSGKSPHWKWSNFLLRSPILDFQSSLQCFRGLVPFKLRFWSFERSLIRHGKFFDPRAVSVGWLRAIY